MLDGLGSFVRGLIPGTEFLSGDALSGAFVDVLSSRLAPLAGQLVAEVRKQLIDATRPDPPATYAAELRTIAPNLRDEQVVGLWAATYRAICADRVAPKPHLALVANECPDCNQPTTCYPHQGCAANAG